MTKILKAFKGYEVMVEGVSAALDANHADGDTYDNLCHTTSTTFIQVVRQDILETSGKLDNHHQMST